MPTPTVNWHLFVSGEVVLCIYCYFVEVNLHILYMLFFTGDCPDEEDGTHIIADNLNMLLDPPPADEIDDFSVLWPLYHLLAYYVSTLYGWTDIKIWLQDNKDKSLLDLFTMSDVAFEIVQVVNGKEKWLLEHRISKMSTDEMEKWKRPKLLSPQERIFYTKPDSKFTARKGRKTTYLGHGYNKEGLDLYDKTMNAYKARANEKEWYEKYEAGWEDYVVQNGVCKLWKKTASVKASLVHAVSMEEEEEEEEEMAPRNLFALPGDEHFVGDCSWKKKPAGQSNETPVDDIESSSGESESEDDDDDSIMLPTSKSRAKKVARRG